MTDSLRKAISERVLATRIAARLTQEQLAAIIERSVEAVSNIERGISLPTVDTIVRIADAVSVPITFFFEDLNSEMPTVPNAEIVRALGLVVAKLSTRDAGLLMTLANTMVDLG